VKKTGGENLGTNLPEMGENFGPFSGQVCGNICFILKFSISRYLYHYIRCQLNPEISWCSIAPKKMMNGIVG